MQEYRDYYRPNSSYSFGTWSWPPAVKWITITCVASYFAMLLLFAVGIARPEQIFHWIGFKPREALIHFKVWQFVTYGFVHERSPFHVLFNMLLLFFFGREMEQQYGTRRFVWLYALSLVFSAFCQLIITYRMGSDVPMVGASGAVFAVMVLYAINRPWQTILFFFVIPMPIWVCVVILIGIDLAYLLMQTDAGVANAAHLGGAFFGWMWFRYHPRVEGYFEEMERRVARREREQERALLREMDRVLAKLHEQGKESLTSEERATLDRASKHLKRQMKGDG